MWILYAVAETMATFIVTWSRTFFGSWHLLAVTGLCIDLNPAREMEVSIVTSCGTRNSQQVRPNE